MDFNKREGKVLIKALNGDKLEPLSCILWQSFKQTWEQNSTYQIEFTAMDDGSESYKNLAVEATIYFDNQQYTVKQPIVDHDGTIEMKSVTALHISNEVSRVHQYQTQKGTLTYSVNDVLAYYLKDNQLGFTYNVFGSFDKVQIANLGNGNGKDMLSKIVSAWQNAIFFPDNKAINIYTPEMFHKNLGNRIIYRKDTSDIKLTYDSTSITNQVKVFGKQKDNSDADNPTYYFEPHLVQNSASIAKWGLFPASNDLSDERFEDAKAIDEYAATTLQPDPTVTLDVSYIGNDKPKAGETRRLEIREKKWNTNVNIVSFVYYPFDRTQNTTITFNNAPANFLDSGSTKTAIENLKTAIANVNDKAGNALVSANGKNHNWYSDTDPAKTHANELAVGDIWFFDDGDDSIEYSWNGVKWIKIVSTKDIDDTIDLAKNNKKDADQMRADANARFEEAEKNIASISDDMSKTENDLKSVDAKFDSKTDTLNQSIIQAKSDISDQVDQLKTVKSTADSALKKANGNDSSISTINQNIDKINGKFDLTATKTDIDTVNKKYTQQQAQIDANTKGITLKASQDSVNTLSQTVTSNSSSLSVLSNEVKQKTSKTDFDTLTGRVSNAEQKIDATADGVTSTVSKVEGLQTQVDNSAVGTNLFVNTGINSSTYPYVSLLNATVNVNGTINSDNTGIIKMTAPINTEFYFRFSDPYPNKVTNEMYNLMAGKTYTISGYANLTDGQLKFRAQTVNGSGGWNDFEGSMSSDLGVTNSDGTTFTKFSYTFTIPSVATGIYISLQAYNFTDGKSVLSFKQMKLELGSHATDWSANPADNATVTALNVVKQTADETYEGLFNKDGSNKIDVTAQGLKAQIETAKESAQGYAKTTIDAKAGEFNANLSSVQTTLQNDATTKANDAKTAAINTASSDATTKANDALNNAKTYANDKVSDLRIGGNNLIPFSNVVAVNSTQTAYDGSNDIRTLTITNGAGGSWGGGIQNNDVTKHEIPWNSYYTYSVEIMPSDSGLHWNSDTNSYPISGSLWNGNDSDDVGNRVMGDSTGSNDKTLIPNVWNKVWVTYKNSNANNKNKVSLYDNSTVGIVNNSGKTVTVKFRHFQGEIGNKPTDWGFSPEDIKLDAQSRADSALNNAKSYANDKATVLQTDYDNKISNTSKEFTEKWTAVTKQVQDSAVGANLLTGTSNQLKSFTSDFSTAYGWGNKVPPFVAVTAGETYTYSINITALTGSFVLGVWTYDSNDTYKRWMPTPNLSNTGVISWVFTVPSGISYVVPHVVHNSSDFTCSAKEEKLEKGSIATPWCPNFNELATQSYAETLVDVKAGSITTDLKSYTDTQANNAKTAAINTASSDATNKANNALNNARTYADNATKDTATEFSKKLTTATQQINSLGQVNLVPNGGFLTGMTGWVQLGSGGFYYSDADSDTVQGHHSLVGQITGETSDRWYGCASPRFAVRAKQSLSARADIMLWQAISGVVQLQIEWFTDGVTGTNGRSGFYGTKCGTSTSGGFKTFKDENFIVPDGVNAARAVIYYQRNAKASTTRIMVTPATTIGEYVDNFVDYTQASTLIDATAGALQAKVDGADYHNLISMNGNGILLDAHGVNNSNKSIILSGDHIKMDSNNPVTIPNAAITELDAGKLKVGSTLNAANVNLINLNADHISSGTLTGVSFHQSSSGHDTWIDGNGVHDYDGSGNNAWIQKGRLQVYDSANQGFFMDAGKLQLTSASAWSTSANPVFGIIKRDSNIFSTSGNGMIIQGTDGLSLRSKSFDSDNGWWEQSSRYDGSGINIKDSGILMASNGRMVITGGTVYKELFNSLPKIEVGTNAWTPNGTGGEAGQNIALKANGIMMDMNGGMYISSYSGGTAEFHNMNVKANSFTNTSLLSKKTNITKLDPAHALSLINKTDIYDYQYKSDVERGSSKHYASFIIDDVNEVYEYTEPDEFLSEDKTGRDDGTQLAYATLAIQELSKQINDLKQEIKNIKQKIGE